MPESIALIVKRNEKKEKFLEQGKTRSSKM